MIDLICNSFLYDDKEIDETNLTDHVDTEIDEKNLTDHVDTEIDETNLTDILIPVRSAKESRNEVNHVCRHVISDTASIR